MVSEPRPQSCQGHRRDGTPCQGLALPTDGYCWAHSPALAEKRREVRQRGGANSARRARLSKLMPPRLVSVYDRLEKALEEVHDGGLDPRQAQAMASLAGALVKVLTGGEMEERIRNLEGRQRE